jgi:hypothetical protein
MTKALLLLQSRSRHNSWIPTMQLDIPCTSKERLRCFLQLICQISYPAGSCNGPSYLHPATFSANMATRQYGAPLLHSGPSHWTGPRKPSPVRIPACTPPPDGANAPAPGGCCSEGPCTPGRAPAGVSASGPRSLDEASAGGRGFKGVSDAVGASGPAGELQTSSCFGAALTSAAVWRCASCRFFSRLCRSRSLTRCAKSPSTARFRFSTGETATDSNSASSSASNPVSRALSLALVASSPLFLPRSWRGESSDSLRCELSLLGSSKVLRRRSRSRERSRRPLSARASCCCWSSVFSSDWAELLRQVERMMSAGDHSTKPVLVPQDQRNFPKRSSTQLNCYILQ